MHEAADVVRLQELLPVGAQCRGADQQRALAVLRAGFQDGAADEGLPEADFVRDDHAAEVLEDAPRAPDAVQLESGQRDVALLLPLLLKLLAVELPEDAHEDQPGRKFLLRLFEDGGKVEGYRLVPQRVEPGLGLREERGVPAPEVQFQVRGQAGTGEVGGAGDEAGIQPVQQRRLGVQEGAFVAARLQRADAQHGGHAAKVTAHLGAEGLAVTFGSQPGFQQLQALCNLATFKGGLGRITGLAKMAAGETERFRFRLGADQQTHAAGLFQPLRERAETGGAHEGGRDADLGQRGRGIRHTGSGDRRRVGDGGLQRREKGVAVLVGDEFRLAHASPRRIATVRSRRAFHCTLLRLVRPFMEGVEDVDELIGRETVEVGHDSIQLPDHRRLLLRLQRTVLDADRLRPIGEALIRAG